MPFDPSIHDWPLPYESRLAKRAPAAIDLLVIHCTELPDLATARKYGEQTPYNTGTGNSGHYYIDRDGSIYRFIADGRVAHHTRGYNERSIGIELINRGRYPDWLDSRNQTMTEPYTEVQITALLGLLAQLKREHSSLRYIAGHEDLDTTKVSASDDDEKEVFRKRDPGPLFPWPRLDRIGLERLR